MAVSRSFLPGLTETSVSDGRVRAEYTRGMDPLVRPFGNATRRRQRASVNEATSPSLETRSRRRYIPAGCFIARFAAWPLRVTRLTEILIESETNPSRPSLVPPSNSVFDYNPPPRNLRFLTHSLPSPFFLSFHFFFFFFSLPSLPSPSPWNFLFPPESIASLASLLRSARPFFGRRRMEGEGS